MLATPRRSSEEVIDLRTAGGTISTTPEHPFALSGSGWVKAGDLRVGDQIASAHRNRFATILAVSHKHQPAVVYNLTIEGAHTYFVGPDALLVHNTCGYTNYDTAYKASRFFIAHEHAFGREVISYTGDDYVNFNNALRGRYGNWTPEEIRYWLDRAAKADQALQDAAKEGLHYSGQVYRGVDLSRLPPEVADRLLSLRPGDHWADNSFLSTSVDRDVAEAFAGPGGVVMSIKSSHAGIAVEGVTKYDGEREVLFPPITHLVCTGRHTDASGRLVLEFEEV